MEFGICLDVATEHLNGTLPEKLNAIRDAGYSYVEAHVAGLSKASDGDIEEVRHTLDARGLRCLRANCLFPGEIRLVGPHYEQSAVTDYLHGAFPKVRALGIQVVVFGSGAARRLPDGENRADCLRALDDTMLLVSDIAASYEVNLALEHLNPSETNVFTTVAEAVDCVERLARHNFGLLLDFFHVDPATDDMRSLLRMPDKLFHAHIATQSDRRYPTVGDKESLAHFFALLREAGYNGTVSVEARLNPGVSYARNLSDALGTLITLARDSAGV